MKYFRLFLLLCAVFATGLHAQTTLQNLDADSITYPNNYNTNYRSWAWIINSDVGCGTQHGCTATAAMSHSSYLSVDGSSLELDLNQGTPCPSGCFGDALYFNRVYHDSTANAATQFTLDLYATMNSVGNSASEALEYTIEQDVQTASNPNKWTPFVYSWQRNYDYGVWRFWDGRPRSGLGGWNVDPNRSWACARFQPAGSFAHFYFHFSRPDLGDMTYNDFTINTTYIPVGITVQAQLPKDNYSDGLTTEIQLDGNTYQQPYSAWTDKWTVAYSHP